MCAKIYCIVVAAGSGKRFGSPLPKQFCQLDGRPVLMTAIDRLRRFLPESEILLVLNRDYFDDWARMCGEHGFVSPAVIAGGDTRWQSVKNALCAIGECSEEDIVMVHDGARPLVMQSTLEELVSAIRCGNHGAIPVVDVTDSLRMLDGGGRSHAVDRACYRAVQTPQAFRLSLLRSAYELPYTTDMTDDASVMDAAGYSNPVLVAGHEATLKITRPQDLDWVELIMSSIDGQA